MEQRRRTVVERPKGIGKLTENGVTVAMVRYNLEKTRAGELREAPANYDGVSQAPSRESAYEVRGRVWSLDGVRLCAEQNLVLHLEDGRALGIQVTTCDGRRGYPIAGASGLA